MAASNKKSLPKRCKQGQVLLQITSHPEVGLIQNFKDIFRCVLNSKEDTFFRVSYFMITR